MLQYHPHSMWIYVAPTDYLEIEILTLYCNPWVIFKSSLKIMCICNYEWKKHHEHILTTICSNHRFFWLFGHKDQIVSVIRAAGSVAILCMAECASIFCVMLVQYKYPARSCQVVAVTSMEMQSVVKGLTTVIWRSIQYTILCLIVRLC